MAYFAALLYILTSHIFSGYLMIFVLRIAFFCNILLLLYLKEK